MNRQILAALAGSEVHGQAIIQAVGGLGGGGAASAPVPNLGP